MGTKYKKKEKGVRKMNRHNKLNHLNKKKLFVLILLMYSTFFVSVPFLKSITPDEIVINPESLFSSIRSGESEIKEITIENNSDEPFEYTLSYDSNLQWDENTIGMWNFNEGSGSLLKDKSPYHNDGEIYGPTWVNGKFGKALLFDGVDDYVVVPTSESMNLHPFPWKLGLDLLPYKIKTQLGQSSSKNLD